MQADAHPYLGGGLFCVLSMPHHVADSATLERVVKRLNHLEMAPQDLPPHLGAWTQGRRGDNPAYCCFLPNMLHTNLLIAMNLSVWAIGRARWAHGVLASMGIAA